MEVALVRWPGEQERLAELRRAGAPRLLIVDAGVAAPVVREPSEDWIRVPASDGDIRARVDGLAARARALDNIVPTLIDGVLSLDGARVLLSPLESRLATCLVRRFRSLTSRDELLAAGWPGFDADGNDLDVHILRLRRRMDPIGLSLRTVRGKGYVLDAADAADAATAEITEMTEPPESVPRNNKKPKPKSSNAKGKRSKSRDPQRAEKRKKSKKKAKKKKR